MLFLIFCYAFDSANYDQYAAVAPHGTIKLNTYNFLCYSERTILVGEHIKILDI